MATVGRYNGGAARQWGRSVVRGARKLALARMHGAERRDPYGQGAHDPSGQDNYGGRDSRCGMSVRVVSCGVCGR